MNQSAVERLVEAICSKGCRQVYSDIQALEYGEKTVEVKHLSRKDRLRVLEELKSIMSVYGESCRTGTP